MKYFQRQVRELCTNYGEIGGILFDGWWPRQKFGPEQAHFPPSGNFDLTAAYDMIHSLQPNALITNNHHILPLMGEDYQVFEIDMPGENATGFNTTEMSRLPLANWLPIGKYWSYNTDENEWKSVEYLMNHLSRCRKEKVYLHLNVAPKPTGEFQPEEIERLSRIGKLIEESRW